MEQNLFYICDHQGNYDEKKINNKIEKVSYKTYDDALKYLEKNYYEFTSDRDPSEDHPNCSFQLFLLHMRVHHLYDMELDFNDRDNFLDIPQEAHEYHIKELFDGVLDRMGLECAKPLFEREAN